MSTKLPSVAQVVAVVDSEVDVEVVVSLFSLSNSISNILQADTVEDEEAVAHTEVVVTAIVNKEVVVMVSHSHL